MHSVGRIVYVHPRRPGVRAPQREERGGTSQEETKKRKNDPMTTIPESQPTQNHTHPQVAVQQRPSIIPTTADGEPLPVLTTTVYQQIATQFIAHVQELVAQVPGYADELPAIKSRRVVTPEFIGMALDAVDSSGELKGVRQMDTDDVREVLQLREAFRPMLSQLAIVSSRLEQLLAAREVKAGRAALAIYNIAAALRSTPTTSTLPCTWTGCARRCAKCVAGGPRKLPNPPRRLRPRVMTRRCGRDG